jgi:hypothetical protein
VYFHRHTGRRIRFWIVVTLICLLGALVAIGIRVALESVGTADFHRYEPVDVPPAEVSERHGRERMEYERRDEVVEKGPTKPPISR